MLEYSLIKQHQPRFNVRLRDDKSYPFLAVTVDDEWPRAMVMRGRKRKGVRYFGPYGHAYAIRETLDLLLRTFPIRTCSDNKLGRHKRLGRPCLLFHIEKCSGPCVGEITPEEYDQLVQRAASTSSTATPTPSSSGSSAQMREAADELEFERAARLRDRLASVRKAIEKQQMVVDKSEDLDVIGIAGDDLEAAVQVFFVRKGRVVGRKGFVLDKVEDLTPGRADRRVLEGLYCDSRRWACPSRCWCPSRRPTRRSTRSGSSDLRGSKVTVRVPQRGDKRALLETVTQNAKEEFTRHRLQPRGRPQQPGPGPQRAAGGARAARGPAAHRVLRHEPHPGQRLRRLDGRARGRPAQQERVPPLQDQRSCRATTTSRPWRRC